MRSASKHTSTDIVFVGWVTLYGLITTAFLSSYCMENYLLAPAHSISRRNASKDSLAVCKIDDSNWEMVVCDRNRWRKMVYSGSRRFQDNANIWAKTKRAARKGDNIDPDLSQFVCQTCGRVCLSNAGLTSQIFYRSFRYCFGNLLCK